jgi:hypothetical protein
MATWIACEVSQTEQSGVATGGFRSTRVELALIHTDLAFGSGANA